MSFWQRLFGDPYVKELDEGRDWEKIPEAQAVAQAGLAALNSSRFEEAMRLAERLRDSYPDFHFPYIWIYNLHNWQRHYDSAREVLLEGLRVARSKYSLCASMGDVEWSTHDLASAVKWWTRSVIIQVRANSLRNHSPFLMLSYVAEGLGLLDCCSRLRGYSDRIHSGRPRLTGDAANELYASTRSQGTKSIKRTLKRLV